MGQKKKTPGNMVQIRLKAIQGLHYDKSRFVVPPGSVVTLTLVNADDMDHNLVFTTAGRRQSVVSAAAALKGKGPELHYIPDDPDLLWHIATVRPGDSAVVTFSAPDREGLYPYVCTYPGHGATMYGVMYVSDKPLQSLGGDVHVPAPGAPAPMPMEAMDHERMHPYQVTPPYLIRTFMTGASPAAIAVNLPDSISYCWDAGECRLRYAWKGGFLSRADLWKRKGNETVVVAGRVFFRDETTYPFLLSGEKNAPAVRFKGYRLVDRYPEFHYQIDDIDVHELIRPTPDGSGLTRRFTMTGVTRDIWFLKTSSRNVEIHSSAGRWAGNRLVLTPREAGTFTVTITEK